MHLFDLVCSSVRNRILLQETTCPVNSVGILPSWASFYPIYLLNIKNKTAWSSFIILHLHCWVHTACCWNSCGQEGQFVWKLLHTVIKLHLKTSCFTQIDRWDVRTRESNYTAIGRNRKNFIVFCVHCWYSHYNSNMCCVEFILCISESLLFKSFTAFKMLRNMCLLRKDEGEKINLNKERRTGCRKFIKSN